MARSRASKTEPAAAPEDDTLADAGGLADDEGGDDEEGVGADGGAKPMTKARAARDALEQGYEGPQEAVAFILREYGIEMLPQHFSAVKSQLRKKERLAGDGPPAPARRGRRPAAETPTPAPSRRPNGGEDFDVLDAMEAIKPLVEQLGAERVKRIVDLLG